MIEDLYIPLPPPILRATNPRTIQEMTKVKKRQSTMRIPSPQPKASAGEANAIIITRKSPTTVRRSMSNYFVRELKKSGKVQKIQQLFIF